MSSRRHALLPSSPSTRCVQVTVIRQFALEQFDTADDDHEQIVELVGYAAGELTYSIHLLSLAKMLLGLALIRHVRIDGAHAGDFAARAADRKFRDDDRVFVAVVEASAKDSAQNYRVTSLPSSCPGLTPVSTWARAGTGDSVDGRVEPGHDAEGETAIRLFFAES